ncbi:MAG TPA: BofC C-terminal domain-containing protein [Mobilitalea sp.]|nr:BofC C-terminal domain-containing protein [Mobilitalea sp.]
MPKEWFRMKLKKASIYLVSFAFLCVMFTTCYYLSYLHALNDFNKRAVEQKNELYALLEKAQPTQQPAEDENVAVSQSEKTVLPTTKYTLETYNMKTGETQTQELNPPAALVGLTRDEVLDYLSSYMKDMPLSEYNKGLISYELVSFSDVEIKIKKSYNEDFVPFRFYVVIKDGYVVVYNSDLKSVYSYTHIEAKNLPEEDRLDLIQGIYVNSLDELYALLESYSS